MALMIMLGIEAASGAAAIAVPGLGLVVGLTALPLTVVFLVWFYRARINAGSRDWPQRWRPGWAIGAWFVPVVWLWFPYQIMADIWRANQPAAERRKRATLPGIWWTCWLLMWITGYQHYAGLNPVTGLNTYSFSLNPGSTLVSKIFLIAAAVALLVIIRTVSNGELSTPPRRAGAESGR